MGLVDDTVGVPIVSLPKLMWRYYLDYLWYYDPDSWVAKIANTAWVLAILVALPIVILGLLDISSYGIARTLGVIDDVKASTSDVASVHANQAITEGNINGANHASHTGSDTDGGASPIRSEEELCSGLPVMENSAEESSASEEQLLDHAGHNARLNESCQSSAPTTSNMREYALNSDGLLHQRKVTKVEYDP